MQGAPEPNDIRDYGSDDPEGVSHRKAINPPTGCTVEEAPTYHQIFSRWPRAWAPHIRLGGLAFAHFLQQNMDELASVRDVQALVTIDRAHQSVRESICASRGIPKTIAFSADLLKTVSVGIFT